MPASVATPFLQRTGDTRVLSQDFLAVGPGLKVSFQRIKRMKAASPHASPPDDNQHMDFAIRKLAHDGT